MFDQAVTAGGSCDARAVFHRLRSGIRVFPPSLSWPSSLNLIDTDMPESEREDSKRRFDEVTCVDDKMIHFRTCTVVRKGGKRQAPWRSVHRNFFYSTDSPCRQCWITTGRTDTDDARIACQASGPRTNAGYRLGLCRGSVRLSLETSVKSGT